jgi:S1-C subfamily serine protease
MAKPGSRCVLIAAAAVAAVVLGSGVVAASGGDDDDRVTIRKVHRERTEAPDSSRGFLGVQVEEEVDLESGGARIDHVVPDSAADESGLREGDVIVGMDGRTIRGPGGLSEALRETKPGDRVKVSIVRDGSRETVTAELGAPRVYERTGRWQWHSHRPLLGVNLVSATPELREHLGGDPDRGVLVGKVVEDSAAEAAGIRVGDLIVGVDGKAIEDVDELREAVWANAGSTVTIELVRDGRTMEVRASLAKPDDESDDAEGASFPPSRTPRAPVRALAT